MALLAKFVPAWTADDAQFVPAWLEEAGGSIGVEHDVETGNIDPTAIGITDGETATPSIAVIPRHQHIHFLFALTNANGKRPTITVDISDRHLSTTMASTWRPVYSYDLVTWHQFTAFTALTTPSRVQFQLGTAFTASTVYIADHPIFRYSDAEALASELLADSSGLVHVSGSADVNGIIGTTPTESDDLGRAVGGNSIWGFRLEDESLTTTDGGPRREIILTCGIHCGEILDGWFLRGMLNWYLNGSGAAHTAFVRNWRVLTYFLLTPNGRKGGHYRTNFRVSTDPNRDWINQSLAETQLVRDALLNDVTRGDVHVDLHTAASQTQVERYWPVYEPTTAEQARYTAFETAYNAVDATADITPQTSPLNQLNDLARWTRDTFGAFSFLNEPGTRTSATVARYEEIGANYLQAFQTMDADGLFYTPISLPDAARNYFLRRRRLQRSIP